MVTEALEICYINQKLGLPKRELNHYIGCVHSLHLYFLRQMIMTKDQHELMQKFSCISEEVYEVK